MKFWLYSILFITMIINSNAIYANNYCEINQYHVISCSIPKHYYKQSFTCLNTNCSINLENQQTHQKLNFPNNENIIILEKHIEIQSILANPEIIKKLCSEEISETTFKKLLPYLKNKSNFLSIHITPKNPNSLLDSYNKEIESQNIIHECIYQKTTLIDNWVITTHQLKKYCKEEINNEKECSEISLEKTSFISYIFSNPNIKTLPYLITIFIIASILGYIYLLGREIKNEKKSKSFFKINKIKIILTLLLLVPLSYCIGQLLSIIISIKYSYSTSITITVLSFIASIIITLTLSSIIEYYIRK